MLLANKIVRFSNLLDIHLIWNLEPLIFDFFFPCQWKITAFGSWTCIIHMQHVLIQILPFPEPWDLGQTLSPVKFWYLFHSILRKPFDLGITCTLAFAPPSSESSQRKVWAWQFFRGRRNSKNNMNTAGSGVTQLVLEFRKVMKNK